MLEEPEKKRGVVVLRKKRNTALLLGQDDESVEATKETQQPVQKEDITKPLSRSRIEKLLEERTIPKVDEHIKDRYLKAPPPDVIDNWYHESHVGRYVHMETVTREGRTFNTKRVQFEFSRMFSDYADNLNDAGVNPVIERLSYASISKISFLNNLEAVPLRYINYFIEYFDPDDELMQAYFSIMFQIMLEDKDVELDPKSFIEAVYAAFTTDSMIDKIYQMVEYNTDESLVKKSDRAYDESIQLTVEHLKAIMGVSILHKFTIPLVSHYYNTRTRLLEEAGMSDKDLYYYTFTTFIPVFDKVYDIDLYNKLYHTSTTRITKTTNQESPMWLRRERLGETPVSHTNELMRDFVTDISQKAVFSKSVIVFIHVCMDKAIHNVLIQPDKFEFSDMSQEASDSVNETMSRWDRWQTDKSFHSQKDRIRSYVSIKDAIYRYGSAVGLDFKRMDSKKPKDIKATQDIRDEYAYYRDNIQQPMNPTQLYIINLYVSSLLGNTEDSVTMEPPEIIKMIMIMKRDLTARNYTYLPFFLTGKVNAAAGKTYNKRRVEKLFEQHPLFEDLSETYSDADGLLNWDRMYGEAKTAVACPIVVVDYQWDELRDQRMTPDEICAVDEFMRFYHVL